MTYDVFISYSRRDYEDVNSFVALLQNRIPGLKCWFDLTGIESGDEFGDKIVSAIDNSSHVLFMVSESSMESTWTKKEVTYAKNTGKRVIPILLKDSKIKGWFLFEYGTVDSIDSTDSKQIDKLVNNLSKWTESDSSINILRKHSQQATGVHYKPKLSSHVYPFSPLFHPIINMGIALQLFLFSLVLLMTIWTFLGGCLALYQHPQVSHVMLILSLTVSVYATVCIKKLQSYWIGLIIILDFIEIYLVSHLGEFLYQNWHLFTNLKYPQSIRYQLLYSLGANMQHHRFMGISTFLITLAIIHTIVICLALCIRKDKVSAWSRMT